MIKSEILKTYFLLSAKLKRTDDKTLMKKSDIERLNSSASLAQKPAAIAETGKSKAYTVEIIEDGVDFCEVSLTEITQ